MDFNFSPATIWFIIGFALLLLEFALPGLIVFFFGFGAWVVAICCLFTDLTFNNQLILFILSSVLSVLLFRKRVKKMLFARKGSTELLEDEFLGKTAMAETDISPGKNGRVQFKGASWNASSADMIYAGEHVTIIGNESIVLIVKSNK